MSLHELLERGLKERQNRWKGALPGVHIEFLDDHLNAIFDGIIVPIYLKNVNSNDLIKSVGKEAFQFLCYKVFGDPESPQRAGSWEDAQKMALKIGEKVARLPQTRIWLVMNT